MSTDDTPDTDEPRHPYETEDSFHPMGEEWEGDMREELEDTEFDADLGMEMARDAQRLVAGEISEEEFYAEYHDDVQEEFEVDERPVFDDMDDVNFEEIDNDSILENLKGIDLEADDVSRRDVMKKMGIGAAFLGYGAYATADQAGNEAPDTVEQISPANTDAERRETRWGMVIDLERCDGCLACVAGCVDENGTSTGANWMYVFTHEDEATEQENFLVRPCQHCTNAPCSKVCPVRARHTREKDGLVLTNYETCIGCRYCQVACPYGVNYFQWGDPDVPMSALEHLDMRPEDVQALDEEERQEALSEANDHVYDGRGMWADSRPPRGTMGKCTMCPSRQDGHTDNPRGTVACEDACNEAGMNAIHFGDIDDEESKPRRYLRQRAENEQDSDGALGRDTELRDAQQQRVDIEALDTAEGTYPMYLVEREDESEDWGLLDTQMVNVSGDGTIEAAERVAIPAPAFEDSDQLEGDILGVNGSRQRVTFRVESGQVGGTFDIALVVVSDDTGEIISNSEFEFEEIDDALAQSTTEWRKLSSFKLLEDLGTQPNITYLGNEPGPNAEQIDGPVSYEAISSSNWGEFMDIIDERIEHLDYGAGGPPEEEGEA